MKTSIWLPASSALVLILSGCTNQNDPNDPLGTGPYDAQGNYHEEWADDPSKWRKPGKRPATSGDDLPMIAQNEQPPLNANPLATPSQKLPPADGEVEIASRSRTTSSAPKSKSRQTASSSEPKRSTKSSSSSRTKSKSKTTRHTVKKGDSLSSIAKKYGSSVSAIQKANGIKGTLIRDGRSLVVPKR